MAVRDVPYLLQERQVIKPELVGESFHEMSTVWKALSPLSSSAC